MIELRPLAQLGITDLRWLRARHHFCFAGFQRADRLEWGNLRVLNHSELAAGAATQPSLHAATEFLLLAEDAVDIVHGDGRKARVAAGEIAAIFTGNGIEFGIANPSGRPARFTTLWLTCAPSSRRAVVRKPIGFRGEGAVLASGLGRDRPGLILKAPARLTHIALRRGERVDSEIATQAAYLVVLNGSICVTDHIVRRHEALAIADETRVALAGLEDAAVLLLEV